MEQPQDLFGNYKYCEECKRPLPLTYKENLCPSCIEQKLFREVKEYIRENDVNEYAQVGLCEYDDGFKAPQWTLRRVESNRFFSESWPVSSLDSHFTYYGWMQSHYLGNTFPYSGYVDYFDSTQS